MKQITTPERAHTHTFGHNHFHHAGENGGVKPLNLAVVLTVIFVFLEGGAGIYTHSLALLSDAGHNIVDIVALLLAWYALHVERRPANLRRTFGSHRVGIITALFNAGSLILIAGFIIVEAIHRLLVPLPVEGLSMSFVALLSLAINGFIAFRLYRFSKDDLNMRAAFVHMASDAAAALGILVTGLVIFILNFARADAIMSVAIAVLLLFSSWGIVRDTLSILLEEAPRNLDMSTMISEITLLPGVESVHDLHVWSISSNRTALSCHIILQGPQESARVIAELNALLSNEYHINHVTIQTQCADDEDPAASAELFCQIAPYCVEHHLSHYH